MLSPIRDIDHAIAQANRLPFGLAAYVFTRDINAAHRLCEEVESGSICLNEWAVSLAETPFGGVKDSGLGREGGSEGLAEYLRIKSIRQGVVGVN
jgi:succinate-semialdehyde dehydrogenase/glutarate-semialdehyde dehydrogenase